MVRSPSSLSRRKTFCAKWSSPNGRVRWSIGFAAETENLIEHGRDKLLRKGADAIVLNDVSRPGIGFDSDRNAATFLTPKTAIELPEMTKHELAGRILDEVIALRRPASVVAETGLVSSNSKLQD